MILTLGDLTTDIIVHTHGPIREGSDVEGQISFTGGGSAANFASWVAYVGVESLFIGSIGEDPYGEILVEEMERRGIELSIKRVKDRRTASILLFVDELGERHMVTDRGASLYLTPDDLDEELFQKAQHLHLTAYSFFGGPRMVETALRAIELAKSNQLSISLDPSSYALLEDFGVQRFLELTSTCHMIFPNYEEGSLLAGLLEEEKILQSLKKEYPLPILKLGERGVLYEKEGESVRIKGPSSLCVDTTGAGDAFAAGFLCDYLMTRDVREACQKGVKLASMAVAQKGGRSPL